MASPTVLVDLDPPYEAGDYIYDFDGHTYVAGAATVRTATMEDDGTYDLNGAPVSGEYINVQVFDTSTGLEHVMSPFGAYINGTIRIGDYANTDADDSETEIEGLGLTVTRSTLHTDAYDPGTVVSQSPAAYWLLTASNAVTLTVAQKPSRFRRKTVDRKYRR